jgi:hypothetical protein
MGSGSGDAPRKASGAFQAIDNCALATGACISP